MAKKFDSFIKELIQEIIDNIPCSPKEEVWEQFITRFRAECKKKSRSKYRDISKFILSRKLYQCKSQRTTQDIKE